MMIKQLYQPEDSNLCGQTCVAMLAGVSLDEAIEAVGTRAGTCGPALHKALKKFGIKTSKKSIRTKRNGIIPENCIARVRTKGSTGCHWILIWNSGVYDPLKGGSGYEYISSYLKIVEV